MTRRSPPHPRAEELLAALEAVYLRADELYGHSSCPRSTDCCHFNRTRREPYVTSIELVAITRAVAAKGGAIPTRPTSDEGRCPLLDDDARCRVYAARPIGCRTYWCARASCEGPEVAHAAMLELVHAIRAIAARHQPDGDRARPLRRALASRALSTRHSAGRARRARRR